MGFFPKRNMQKNRMIRLPEGMLNGQGLGELGKMTFGCSTVSYSGCEVIAVYNAQLLTKGTADFCETARYMERFRVLLGFWGTNFLMLGVCLRHFGLRARGTRSRRKLDKALCAGKSCLFVYWTRKRFCSPVHTVLIVPEGEEQIKIYNLYNNLGTPAERERAQFLQERLIVGYVIGGADEEREGNT